MTESLSVADPVVLQTTRSVVQCGASHPTLRLTDLPRVPLTVPRSGLQVKENARVSTLVSD